MVVQLTTDIAGLGLRDDQIIVKAGRMRQDLFPAGLALYTRDGQVIPNTPFGTILPSSRERARNAADLARRRGAADEDPFALPIEVAPPEEVVKPETVVDALPEPKQRPKPRGPSPEDIELQSRIAAEREQSLGESLRRVGSLVFHRRVRDPEHGLLYGSVTVDEVRRVLGESHSIVVEQRAVFKRRRGAADEDAENRVRTLGRHTLLVRMPVLREDVPLRIDVKAEAE